MKFLVVVIVLLWSVAAFAQTATWTDPNVDRVVPAGQTVTLDSHARARTVTVEGTLKVSRSVDSSLTLTRQLMVNPAGTWDQGTVADPLPCERRHRLIFTPPPGQTFVGGADYSADPGLWVRGTWLSYGCEVKRAWGKLAADVAVGAMSVTVDGDVSDWPVGSEIVVTQTSYGDETGHTEIATIQSVSGSTLYLAQPLTRAHQGSGLERGDVGLLTRNVGLETTLSGVTNIRQDQTQRMFACVRIYDGGRAYLGYTQFARMGAYGVNGCFPLHWHRLGDVGRGQWALGLSFLDTGFRCTNVHESNGVRVEDTVVAYSGNGICHWVQTDTPSLQVDHEYVHNLVAGHDPSNGDVPFGEMWDEAAAFWPGVSDHEFFAGNVAAGRGYSETGTTGFAFFAGVRATASGGVGQLPRVFIKNEAHGLLGGGIISGAQRNIPFTDIVDTHSWRNVYGGIRHGAYNYRLTFHRARLVDNPVGFHAFASTTLLQDAVIVGRGPNGTRFQDGRYYSGANGEDVGVQFSNNSQYPFEPKRFQRVSISDLTPGLTGQPGIGMLWPGSSVRADGLCDPLYALTFPGSECGSGWARAAGITFGPNLRPRKYTATLNANDALFDFSAGAVFFGPDQNPPAGAAAQRFFVSGVTTYDAAADALKTPLSALSPVLEFVDAVGFNTTLDFTVPVTHNEPPQVELAYTLNGRNLTLTATASSNTTKVEYFVDTTKVGETTANHQITVDLGTAPRRYAYVYARAFDGVTVDTGCVDFGYAHRCEEGYAQRGYSVVHELGPELLLAPAPAPAPPPPTIEQLQKQIVGLQAQTTQIQPQLLPLAAASAFAQIQGQVYASGFESPLAFVQDPTDRSVQFVVQQTGRIRVVRNGTVLATDFLNLTASIVCCGEQGLLGLAFAPDYASSGRFFVNFTNTGGDTVIARFRRSANPLVADPGSRFDLVFGNQRFIDQPFANHNGGHLAFGPDGFMYIGLGDGGSGNDPGNRAQNPFGLLGKMLRIDVNVSDDDSTGYRIPPDNPFAAGHPGRDEIWAFGLRNPWRYSFDDVTRGGTGALVIGDVGQNRFEEIDYEPRGAGGRNYGWRNREGAHDNVTTQPPAYLPLIDPIFEYGRSDGVSVTGGFVYRGSRLGAANRGRYFFADYSGRVWSLALTLDSSGEATASDLREHTNELGGRNAVGFISSFGVDADGELYIVNHSGGTIIRMIAPLTAPPAPTDLKIVKP